MLRPYKQGRLRISYEAFGAIHPGMFGQIVVMRLFRDFGFLTQVSGNHFMVLKVAPPLAIEKEQMNAFCGGDPERGRTGEFSGEFLVRSPGAGAQTGLLGISTGWCADCSLRKPSAAVGMTSS